MYELVKLKVIWSNCFENIEMSLRLVRYKKHQPQLLSFLNVIIMSAAAPNPFCRLSLSLSLSLSFSIYLYIYLSIYLSIFLALNFNSKKVQLPSIAPNQKASKLHSPQLSENKKREKKLDKSKSF